MKPRVSVLLPILNEEGNLRPLFQELGEALDSLGQPYEIIAIDDGSQDASPKILADLVKANLRIKAIFFRRNAGQTAAFDAGFRHASGEIIVTMDSDLQNDPRDIPRMIALLDQGYDFISGWRKNRKDGFILRTFPSRIANWIIRKVTKTKVHDLGCSLKVYRRELTDELRIYGEMHRFIAVLVEGLGARVGEIEVNHRARVAGVSKYNLSRSFKVLIDLVTVWFLQGYRTKPGYIFGGMSAGLLGTSGLLCVYVLWEKFAQGIWVHRNPLFMIAIFFGVIAVQFLGLGLLAELIIRTYFESSARHPYSITKKIGFERERLPVEWTTLRSQQPLGE
jgi:glycosyltransferase involved in cell wall biosynthesis